MRKEVLERFCPICQHSSGNFLYHQKFDLIENAGYNQIDNYDVVCCLNCGFVFADIPKKLSFEKNQSSYYKKTKKYIGEKAPGSGISEWDAARFKAMACDIDILLNQKKNSKILDIGCGSGGLLLALKSTGYLNLDGIDISENCIEIIKNNYINGYVANFSFDDFSSNDITFEKYDCVILSHVMEHLYDLEMAANNAISCLKEDGILYVEVPDATRYADYYSIPYHSFDLEHINHFDAVSMDNLILKYNLINLDFKIKEVPLTRKFSIPAFYKVYRKAASKQNYYIKYSNLLIDSIKRYIDMSNKSNKWPCIEKFADNQEDIVIWGADWFASWLLANSQLKRCNIAFFVDNDPNKQGHKLSDRQIMPVESLMNFKGSIVICSAFHADSILTEIKKRNIINEAFCVV